MIRDREGEGVNTAAEAANVAIKQWRQKEGEVKAEVESCRIRLRQDREVDRLMEEARSAVREYNDRAVEWFRAVIRKRIANGRARLAFTVGVRGYVKVRKLLPLRLKEEERDDVSVPLVVSDIDIGGEEDLTVPQDPIPHSWADQGGVVNFKWEKKFFSLEEVGIEEVAEFVKANLYDPRLLTENGPRMGVELNRLLETHPGLLTSLPPGFIGWAGRRLGYDFFLALVGGGRVAVLSQPQCQGGGVAKVSPPQTKLWGVTGVPGRDWMPVPVVERVEGQVRCVNTLDQPSDEERELLIKLGVNV